MDRNGRDVVSFPRHPPSLGLSLSTTTLPTPTASSSDSLPPQSTGGAANLAALEYVSPPSSGRTTIDDKTYGSQHSLPSIHDALGESAQPLPGSGDHHSTLTRASIGEAPTFELCPSWREAPPRASHPFLPAPSKSGYRQPPPHPVSDLPQEPDPPHRPDPPSLNPLHTSLHPADAKTGEPVSAQPAHPTSFYVSPCSKHYGPPSTTSSAHQPPHSSLYPPTTDSNSSSMPTPVQASENRRIDSTRKLEETTSPLGRNHATQAYSESVKRHLDSFDVELTLNEVANGSRRALEFAKMWDQRTQQQQRNGHLPTSLPSLPEIDDLMRQTSRVIDAFSRIKEAVVAQECALAEEQARAQERGNGESDLAGHHAGHRDSGNMAENDSRKRRGKAAPPGRCHSCNRAETPEWRRGPDGARTLCNACGLHYAKLTRKISSNKMAALSGSSLRPKNLENSTKI